MSLLALEHVGKRYRRGRHECVALDDVSLTVEPGEHVAVWGLSRSGRTTLLRIAAGLERPDHGVIRFAGRQRVADAGLGVQEGIAFVRADAVAGGCPSVLDDVAIPLLARGCGRRDALARSACALERVGAGACAGLPASDLDATEVARVAIAQALVTDPDLLVVDDPTRDVELLERESVLLLLRSIADEDDVAVLMTTGESIGLSGVDRALTISEGTLRSEVVVERAHVVPLPHQPSSASRSMSRLSCQPSPSTSRS